MGHLLENNRLIAEFLGQKSEVCEFPQFGYIDTKGDFITEFNYNKFKFHKDWNWLMFLVEKIEELGFETSLDKNGFFVRYNGSNTQSGLFNKNKIESVYSACVEFIKCYNFKN